MHISLWILIIVIVVMIIFNNKNQEHMTGKKVVFLHIPKNAGMAFIRSFHPIHKLHNKSFPKKSEINIAIVRNPEKRLQSIFAHIWERTHIDKNAKDLKNFETLHDLADAYYDKSNPLHKKALNLLSWTREKFRNAVYPNLQCGEAHCVHWAPQNYYVFGHDSKVDYLLKFENLDSDIGKLKKLGIINPKENMITFNKSRSDVKKNRTVMTPLCKKLAQDIYREDYALWQSAGIS